MNKDSEKVVVDYYRTKDSLEYIDRYDGEGAWQRLRLALHRRRVRRRMTVVSSAAAVLLFFGVFYLWEGRDEAVRVPELADSHGDAGGIGSAGVMLMLPDGRQVDLSASDGEVLPETGVVNKRDSKQLVYEPARDEGEAGGLNRLEVPRGAEYRLVLPDGTRVWINSESRLVFPMAFGGTREVELVGEAYFEVTHDEARPFVVRAEGMRVKVLGTEFNVNTRPTSGVQAVLVKGKVEVDAADAGSAVLRPGELAELTGGVIEVKEVNVRKYTAWRYGEFYFENNTLEEIMAELTSWYGMRAEFVNSSLRERKFSGVLNRDEAIRDVLRKMELTSSARFTIQGDVIVIK